MAHQVDRIKRNQEVGVKYMQLWEENESTIKNICDAITRYPELTDDELAERISEQKILEEP